MTGKKAIGAYRAILVLSRRQPELAGDLSARIKVLDFAEQAYNAGDCEAAASLVHAELYLGDRSAYKTSPTPKNMIPIYQEDHP